MAKKRKKLRQMPRQASRQGSRRGAVPITRLSTRSRSSSKKLRKARANSREVPVKPKYPIFTVRLKRWILVILMLLLTLVICFSFFEKAGAGGNFIFKGFYFFIGKTIFILPFLLVLASVLILKPQKKRVLTPTILGLSSLIIGISGVFAVQDMTETNGGWLGHTAAWPLFNYFGKPLAMIVFFVLVLIGALISWEFFPKRKRFIKKGKVPIQEEKDMKSLLFNKETGEKKFKFRIKPIELPQIKKEGFAKEQVSQEELQGAAEIAGGIGAKYQRPPLNLLDTSEEKPSSGDIKQCAIIIKKTLLNFNIEVEMSEVNIGPTVAQYTFKPAEGVKLSKITALNNDLALALASHPIRIEAPIPGRSLVGIEVPNKVRAKVKIGNLVGLAEFQKSTSPLVFALGKDVMGKPLYPDLDRMPHLLVAGATGSGKTICLNSLILSLIYRNSPKILKFILIDPKRVEFPIYGSLPHLLTPVIFESKKAVNVLNWLVGEMERRFEVLREFGARDIGSFNKALQAKSRTPNSPKNPNNSEIMPYIILIIDELADLMAAKGREVEAGIVRLSQLARAVGIHLVVATQRPSVEVITGLIKANITSRVAFQVASQVDSRTILDSAGADKLLGRGDMLFISSEFSKPKRIQGSFVGTSEIKKVVKFIAKENAIEESQGIASALEGNEGSVGTAGRVVSGEDIADFTNKDSLYPEAREVVLQYRKASASLLQRRLKIGYARAARILDMMEDDGVIGPQEGSKPREVFIKQDKPDEDGFQDPSTLKFG